MRPIIKIIIQIVNEDNASELIKKHLSSGMPEVGFHHIIETDGNVVLGRSINNIGNHLIGYNADSIGIACIGTSLTKKHESVIDSLLEELSIKGIDVSNVFLVEGDELKKYK